MSAAPIAAPSTADVGLRRKAAYAAALLRDAAGELREGLDYAWVWDDLDEYDALLREHAGTPLADARVLEIGFGAEPYRLIALTSLGVDARGVDPEVPVLRGGVAELRAAWRRNGAERAIKSAVRGAIFDRPRRRAFTAAMRQRGVTPRVDPARFLIANAADLDVPPGSLDLVTSEDVFEHIDRPSLERLVPRMAAWLRDDGIALVRPNVFTGITGGHVLEYNRRAMRDPGRARQTPPWDHLRARTAQPSTYLNELTRADYRDLLSPSFDILDERVKLPDLGADLMTPAIRQELAAYPDEELFSNQVLFVLRPRR